MRISESKELWQTVISSAHNGDAVTNRFVIILPSHHPHSRLEQFLLVAFSVVLAYIALAYLALPALWNHYEHQRRLADLPMVTRTAQGIPGDPINVGLIGDKLDVLCAMRAAGWYPADPVTLRSSIEIAGSVLLDRPYHEAPVSPLFYLGRREDFAFEKPAGASADRRHHVRFWKVLDHGQENRPVWLGDATFDRGVGISHYTGAITHHISADIDAERSLLASDLEQARMVDAKYQVTGIGVTLDGRNGGGDSYYTDGEIDMGSLVADGVKRTEPPANLPPPPLIALKDQVWHDVGNAIGQ
jgi:hypothetical protein